jgi:hypothetical protein
MHTHIPRHGGREEHLADHELLAHIVALLEGRDEEGQEGVLLRRALRPVYLQQRGECHDTLRA